MLFFFAKDVCQSFVHPNANSEVLFWTSSATALYFFLFCKRFVYYVSDSFELFLSF